MDYEAIEREQVRLLTQWVEMPEAERATVRAALDALDSLGGIIGYVGFNYEYFFNIGLHDSPK